MQSANAELIFANEADPAFRRRARWIEDCLTTKFRGQPFQVADIGCGRGFYFPLYAALHADIWGLEQDPEPLAVAKIRAVQFGARVEAASAYALPLPSDSLDAVVMSEILEHLDTPIVALEEARRVLRPGGMLLATVPNANYPFLWDPLNWTLERTIGRPVRRGTFSGIWANHVRLYTGDSLVRQVQEAGLVAETPIYHTRHSLPFIHNIVYGFGKPLLEHRILPSGWAASAERAGETSGGGLNPVALGISLIQWFDRRNNDSEPPDLPTQNICLMATKP